MDSGMLFLRLVPRPPLCDEAVELADDVRELRRNHRAEEEKGFKVLEPRFSRTRQNNQRGVKTKKNLLKGKKIANFAGEISQTDNKTKVM